MRILQEDYDLAKARLGEITQDLKNLAEEFNIVLNQSSETWHDNAPWDDAKGRERSLLTEQDYLKKVLSDSRVEKVTPNSLIGNKYKVQYAGREVQVYLAGDFTMRLGEKIDGHTVVTLSSPIGKTMLED